MTESEFIEAITSYMSISNTLTNTQIGLITAYLIMSYLVGSNLSRFQVTVISVLYSAAYIFVGFMSYTSMAKAYQYAARMYLVRQEDTSYLSMATVDGALVLMLFCLLATYWFMWSIRRKNKDLVNAQPEDASV